VFLLALVTLLAPLVVLTRTDRQFAAWCYLSPLHKVRMVGLDVENVLRMDGTRIRRRALELKFKGDKPWGGPGTARYSSARKGEGIGGGGTRLETLRWSTCVRRRWCQTKRKKEKEASITNMSAADCLLYPRKFAFFQIEYSLHQERVLLYFAWRSITQLTE
jgi:hypothetical protein